MLLTKEEIEHCTTLKNPHQFKHDRFHRLFPAQEKFKPQVKGGPFIKRLHVYRYAAGASIGGIWNFIAPLPSVQAGLDASTPSPDELTKIVRAVTFLKEKRILPNYLPRAVMRTFKDRYCSKVDGFSQSACQN